MSTKQKTASAKAKWQAVRERYTWHLRPPFKEQFDRSHWWLKRTDSEVDPAAALYELARRHPRVGQLRNKLRHASWHGQELRTPFAGTTKKRMLSQAFDDLGEEPKAIHCLCLIGLKSWPKLGWSDQEYWEMSAGKIKGVDCRHDIERCHSVTEEAQQEILLNRARALKCEKGAYQFWVGVGRKNNKVTPAHPRALAKAMVQLAEHVRKNPISTDEMDAAIARQAVAAHREGHLLLSVASNLTADEARILLERAYRHHLKQTPSVQQRARWKDWLPLITAFEDEEAGGGKKSQAFTRYRRAMDSIKFNQDLAEA